MHPADVVTNIAFDFKDERGRSPLGIRRVPAQELAGERVHTGRGLAGPDRAENPHADIESTLRDRQPFRGRALGEFDWVMYLAGDDRRAVRRRRKRPRGKAGPEPQTDTCGWRIGKNSRVVRCARRPEPESSAKTAFVRCTIEAVPSVSQGGRAIGVERWRVLSNQIFSRFRRQAAIGV